ncbi:hypothetical protein HUW63_31610 [Myxococcus sp. AM001]|nr:hypothetical protein [Myxococcus sp. AM001]
MPMVIPRRLVSSVLAISSVLAFANERAWGEKAERAMPYVVPGLVAAIVGGGFSLLFNKRLERQRRGHSEELAKLNADLTKSVQKELETDRAQRTEALEHLKRDLQDTLASRARRADYLRTQINNLYGPLAILLESSNTHIIRAFTINSAAARLRTIGNGKLARFMTSQQEKSAQEAQSQYDRLATKGLSDSIVLLSANWGWLDENDRPILIDFIRNINQIEIESRSPGHQALADAFFDTALLKDIALRRPRTQLDLITAHVNKTLNTKQRELSGLTSQHSPSQPSTLDSTEH